MPQNAQIQLRRDTAGNWIAYNPVLAIGEMGLETDTRKMKFGDGVNAWTALGYTSGGNVFTTDITVPDEAYGPGWNGSLEVPTKNAVYDEVEQRLPAQDYGGGWWFSPGVAGLTLSEPGLHSETDFAAGVDATDGGYVAFATNAGHLSAGYTNADGPYIYGGLAPVWITRKNLTGGPDPTPPYLVIGPDKTPVLTTDTGLEVVDNSADWFDDAKRSVPNALTFGDRTDGVTGTATLVAQSPFPLACLEFDTPDWASGVAFGGGAVTPGGRFPIGTYGAITGIEFGSVPYVNNDAILTAADKGVANGVASLDGTGKVPPSQLPATTSISGNAATATALQTSRNFSITGAGVTAPAVGFDGTANVVLAASVDAGHITLARMANLAANSILGNNTGASATPIALSGAQVTAMLSVATSGVKGVVTPPGGTTNFLRADGTWAAPPGGSGGGLTDGDKGDVVVSGSGSGLTVESATPADGSFDVTGSIVATGGLATNGPYGGITTSNVGSNPSLQIGANGVAAYSFLQFGTSGTITSSVGAGGAGLYLDAAATLWVRNFSSGTVFAQFDTNGAQFSVGGVATAAFHSAGIRVNNCGSSSFTNGSAAAPADVVIYFDNTNYYNNLIFRHWDGSAYSTHGSILGYYGNGLWLTGNPLLHLRCGADNVDAVVISELDATHALVAVAGKLTVNDDPYAAGWDGNFEVPTKNAVYDKIQSLAAGGVTSFNTRTGAVVLNSGDVTTALGFTPAADVLVTSGVRGLAPPSGGGTANFLRADGTWVAPPSGAMTDGDKGDVVVGGGGTTLTVESANPAGGTFNVGVPATAFGKTSGSGADTTLHLNSTTTINAIDFNFYSAAGASLGSGGNFFSLLGNGLYFTGVPAMHLRCGADFVDAIVLTELTSATALAAFTGNITVTGSITASGKVNTVASAAAAAGFNLPHGAAPTTPVNGDVWTTTLGLFSRINGVTLQNVFAGSVTTSGLTMNTAKLLGRTTAAAGAPEEITPLPTLLLSAGNLSVASVPNALTGNNSGTGAASGGTYNGSAAVTFSWNTLGACPDTPRIQAAAAESITPTFSNDIVQRLACVGAITLNNPTGTAVDGWGLVVRLRSASAQTIAYGTQYRAVGVVLPTTTTAGKLLILGFLYNSTDTKWDCVAVAGE